MSQSPLENSMSQQHIKHGAVDIHFGNWSAIERPSLAVISEADIDCVGHQSISNATVPLVHSQLELWVLYGVVTKAATTDNTGVLAGFLEDIKANTGDQKIGVIHIDTEPFTFYNSRPCFDFGDTSPWVSAFWE